MKHLIRFSAIIFVLFLFDSCDSNNDSSTPDPAPNPSTTTFIAGLSSLQEVPRNSSMAIGSAVLTFDTTTKIFTISIDHSIPSPTAAYIQMAAFGVSGNTIFTLPSVVSPVTYTSSALTAAQEADLNAEQYYVNIHSAEFPNGEIRGQLYKQIYNP